MDPQTIRASLMGTYRRVVDERIATLRGLFGTVLKAPGDEKTAVDLARELHTLRGESRLMGVIVVDKVLYAIENAVKAHREARFAQLGGFERLFNEGLDAVAAIVLHDAQPDLDAICGRIESHLSTATQPPGPASAG